MNHFSQQPNMSHISQCKPLEARHPRFRYPVGFFARLDHLLRGTLPTRLIRRGTTRYLGIPRTR